MEVINEVEHEDGSATYTIDMTEDERRLMTEQGILWGIVAGITGATPESVLDKWIQDKALDELVEQTQQMEKSDE